MLSKKQISSLNSLHQKKFRKESGSFIAEGDKVVIDLLRSDYEVLAIYATKEKLEEFSQHLAGIDTHLVDMQEMGKISTLTTPQQILAVAKSKESTEEIDLAVGLKLVLDGIKDPGNFGTLIRIADWFGFNEIICSTDTVEQFNPKVIQAAMGSVFRVNIHYVNLENLLEKNSTENEVPVYGTLMEGESLFKTSLGNKGLIVLGNESEGISQVVKKYISHAIHIPGFSTSGHGPDSLNVAVAAGIVCAFFRKNGEELKKSTI